jgi:hypothetical protein
VSMGRPSSYWSFCVGAVESWYCINSTHMAVVCRRGDADGDHTMVIVLEIRTF